MEKRAAQRAGLAASPRLFGNPLLEWLSRVHHLTPALLYLPIVAILSGLSAARVPFAYAVPALFAGYLIWTGIEYFGHRFLFHLQPPGRLGAQIHFTIHGVHHAHPGDPLRLVMPPLMSVPIMLLALAGLRAVFGPDLVLPALAGLLAGYVAYDMLHYHLHHGRPATRLGRELRRRHMLHHFHDDTRGFGISAPWWDDILGTRPIAGSSSD
jgi:dihydroceramide fatty acyl 2-hydroxylase